MKVSVHELKNNLSKYLRLVVNGESVVVTSHKKALAKLVPMDQSKMDLKTFLASKGIYWTGKKPKGGRLLPKIKGKKTVAEMVLEDRR